MSNRMDNLFTSPGSQPAAPSTPSEPTQPDPGASNAPPKAKRTVQVNDLYKRTEVIGRGKFGIVYKGYNRQTSQVVAIKVLNLDTDQEEVKDVQQEIAFLSQLKQAPNITHYHGSYLSDTKLWIIMDHCAGGSVRSLLKPGRIEEKYIGVIVRELLVALQYVHRAGVIHRDLKAANVLITREGNVQLCDFGVAAQLTSNALKRTTMAGTPYWMAPEVIMEGAKYDVKVDIWSLGITIYEVATGNPPYSDKDAMRAMQLITKSKPPRLEGRNHSTLLKEMIALCLDENPDERPSADDLLKSRFIKAHRATPNAVLKEIISRYLLWREKKSSRDSMLYGVEEDLAEQNGNAASSNGDLADDLDVKWDFNSLSSSEYIIENDINVNQLAHQPEYGDELYNDDDFMTSNQQTYMTGKDGLHTSRDDPTLRVTATTTAGHTAGHTIGHTMGTRKEAPKSLLQLFEEDEDDHAGPVHHTSKNNDSIPKLPTMASSNIPRSSSPMIEIPNMDDITASEPPAVKPRSRAPTLSHTQSAAAVLARAPEIADLPQRRPTISQSQSPVSASNTAAGTGGASHGASHGASAAGSAMLPPASLTQSTSNLSQMSGRTPSPKRTHVQSTDHVNLSPQRISGMTPSFTMKPLPSSTNMSALLQPINKSSADVAAPPNGSATGSATRAHDAAAAAQAASPTPAPTSKPRSKNISNLHLRMPAPTAASPSLQALTNFDPQQQQQQQQIQQQQQPAPLQHPRGYSVSVSPASRDSSRINQFGYDASQAPSAAMAMTPLNEKSQASVMSSFLNGGKATPTGGGSITPPRETKPKPASSNSRSGSASFFISKDDDKRLVFPNLPEVRGHLLLDSTDNCKQKLIEEISDLSGKFIVALDALEENFNVYIE